MVVHQWNSKAIKPLRVWDNRKTAPHTGIAKIFFEFWGFLEIKSKGGSADRAAYTHLQRGCHQVGWHSGSAGIKAHTYRFGGRQALRAKAWHPGFVLSLSQLIPKPPLCSAPRQMYKASNRKPSWCCCFRCVSSRWSWRVGWDIARPRAHTRGGPELLSTFPSSHRSYLKSTMKKTKHHKTTYLKFPAAAASKHFHIENPYISSKSQARHKV